MMYVDMGSSIKHQLDGNLSGNDLDYTHIVDKYQQTTYLVN